MGGKQSSPAPPEAQIPTTTATTPQQVPRPTCTVVFNPEKAIPLPPPPTRTVRTNETNDHPFPTTRTITSNISFNPTRTTTSVSFHTTRTTSNGSLPTTRTTSNASLPTTRTSNASLPTTRTTSNASLPTARTPSNASLPTARTRSNASLPTTRTTSNASLPTTRTTSNASFPTTRTASNVSLPTTSTPCSASLPTTRTSNASLPTTRTSNASLPTTRTSNASLPTTRTPSNASLPTTRTPSNACLPTARTPSNASLPTTRTTSNASLPTTRTASNVSLPTTRTISNISLPTTWTTSNASLPTTRTTSNASLPITRTASNVSLPTTRTTSNASLPTTWTTSNVSLPTTRTTSNASLPTARTPSNVSLPTTWTTSNASLPTNRTPSNASLTTTRTSNASLLTTRTPSTVSLPTTSNVSIPTTASNVSLPTAASNVSLPTTASNVSLPTTASNVSLPTTASNVSHPTTASNVSFPTVGVSIDGTRTNLPTFIFKNSSQKQNGENLEGKENVSADDVQCTQNKCIAAQEANDIVSTPACYCADGHGGGNNMDKSEQTATAFLPYFQKDQNTGSHKTETTTAGVTGTSVPTMIFTNSSLEKQDGKSQGENDTVLAGDAQCTPSTSVAVMVESSGPNLTYTCSSTNNHGGENDKNIYEQVAINSQAKMQEDQNTQKEGNLDGQNKNNPSVPLDSRSIKATSKPEENEDTDMTNKTESKTQKKPHSRMRPTSLYVKFGEVIGEAVDVSAYIVNRLPTKEEFTVEDKVDDDNSNNSIVTLRCESKRSADRIKFELHKGNTISETKISCFDTLHEAKGQRVRSHAEAERQFEGHFSHLRIRSEDVLRKHYDKLNEVKNSLEQIHETSNRNLSLKEFREHEGLRKALEDKQKELSLQKEEFLCYLRGSFQRLQDIKYLCDFNKQAVSIRQKLAIEYNRLTNGFPIYARRSDIVNTVKNHQVSVVIGETGSGKSTQMTQYLHEAGVSRAGLIACTQPRKIAATSLATHVAREMGVSVGQLVGYKVGLQTHKSALTKILYMTDHVLLNECLQDPLLSNFSCIIIDEAHERSIFTDLLLGMIKQCLRERPDLRLVITSATISPAVFVKYFHNCPVLYVSGRMFPVEVEWQRPGVGVDSFDNYQEKAVKKAVEVHLTEEEGDILVFLTSPLETEKACERFQDLMEGRAKNYVTMQLHGKLQGEEQQRVFDPTPLGKRKVVFATNSAETSVTIPGMKYVVDSGLVKEMKFDAVRKMSTLSVTMVTQSSAKQRQGRAGRLGPGKCFRLYTENDFKKMEPDTLPEILRVHIGHAMLKLMELGVDPIAFDYIESPSIEAMQEAMASLEHLGAVSQKKITDLGKWISKMPFEPRYGALVYEGVKLGIGVEAIVVAAASGTNTVFYRCGSNEEKEKADRQKIPFCHEGGDQLTVLNVFREWHKVQERDKGKWCAKHYINGKSVKGIRETTSEVLHTLKKELSVDIKFSFKQPSDVDGQLAQLLFMALERNLSYFLGHKKAGYLVVQQEQRVEPHPSSALLPLAGQPQWVVFDQVMRTTRDFAMQITPVPEAEVLQAVQDGRLKLDVDQVRKKCITVMCKETVGSQLFREVVGPRYTDLRTLESQLAVRCGQSVVVVEADPEKGCLQVLSTEKNFTKLCYSLTPIVPPLRTKFALEESEERLGSVSVDGGVRAVIGAGGSVLNIFMPEEYKAILVFCSLNNTEEEMTVEDILKEYGQFGAIKEYQKIYPKKQTSPWGKIVYETPESAVQAVEAKLQSPEASNWARPTSRAANNQTQGFRAKIQWCRRPSRGFGFVDFANVEDFVSASCRHFIFVGGTPARVKVARNSPQSLHVAGLSMLANEDVLRDAFANEFNIDPVKDITRVSIIREKVNLDKEMFNTCKRRLHSKIKEFVDAKHFNLEMRDLRSEKDVNFVAFCSFTNPEEGHMVCSNINNIFQMNGKVVSMKADIHSSMFIHRDIFKMSGDEIKKKVEELDGNAVRVKIKHLKNENVVLDLQTESAAALAQARASIQAIICGDVMECQNNHASVTLFSREGKKKLQDVMAQTQTLIITDNRLMCISFHGPQRNRQEARTAVDRHLEQLSLGNYRDLELKGGGRPPGVMKALMLQFGTDLAGLVAKTNTGAIKLDHKNHRLRVFGTQEGISRTDVVINEIMSTMAINGKVNVTDDAPDCVICFCPVEAGGLYIVECCGHAYCRECMQGQLDTAVADKNFPIVCGQEGCGTQFVWRDLVNLSRRGQVTLARLVEASVGRYVAQNQDRYHYCTTPDCPIVYRSSNSGALFSCPECGTRICTSCHVQYHHGISCAMFSRLGRDASLQEWLSQDQGNRKICPNCTTPIEKIGGCQHITCSGCRKHICWVCLAIFDSSAACYSHMTLNHNTWV